MKKKFCNILTISAHASMLCADNHKKDMFYGDIQLLKSHLKSEMLKCGENWNVRHNAATSQMTGASQTNTFFHMPETINFCYQMYVPRTGINIFSHMEYSPYNQHFNQIYYI